MRASIISNAKQIAAKNRKRAALVLANVGKASQAIQSHALIVAKEVSTGPLRGGERSVRKQLRRLGYPYAAGHLRSRKRRRMHAPVLPGPDYMINVQTGVFRRGWRSWVSGGSLNPVISLNNVSNRAKWMDGTPHGSSIARPTKREILRRVRPVQRALWQDARRKAMRGQIL